jgi:hypothetical protein
VPITSSPNTKFTPLRAKIAQIKQQYHAHYNFLTVAFYFLLKQLFSNKMPHPTLNPLPLCKILPPKKLAIKINLSLFSTQKT